MIFPHKTKYWQKYKGAKFCWIITWVTIFRSGRILSEYYALLSDHVTDLLSHIALRLLKIIEPYLVELERMANAQLLVYGSKHLGQNLFFY